MKKICTLILFAYGLNYAQPTKIIKVKNLNQGSSFTSLAIDGNGKLWAGTVKNGLWASGSKALQGNAQPLGPYSSDPNFNLHNIQTVGTQTLHGKTTVWVGTNGMGGGTASGGGIFSFTDGSTSGKRYSTELHSTVAKGMGIPAQKNEGVPTRNCKAITVDQFGGVWSAHGYHDLTVTGATYMTIHPYMPPVQIGKNGYYVTPGGVGYKAPQAVKFDNLSNSLLPNTYPAYTINTPVEKTAQTRTCYSIATGPKETWIGGSFYEKDLGGYQYSGITRFDIKGNFVGFYNATNTPDLPFTTAFGSPIPMVMHFKTNGDAIVAFNQNKGFSYFTSVSEAWKHISTLYSYNHTTKNNESSQLLPNGIRINNSCPHIMASQGNRFIIGTIDGLLIYKGQGGLDQDSSYMLLTIGDGLSSNNIKAVVANSKNIYIATDKGIDEIYLPGDLEVMHVQDKNNPFEAGIYNYHSLAILPSKTKLDATYKDQLPRIVADGTTSTVFRFYTNDFDSFYTTKNYDYGINDDFDELDTNRYGKLILKPLAKYFAHDKNYVDFIYRHPKYIDPSNTDKNDFIVDLKIFDYKNNQIAFQHELKITRPPILLVHDVWSEKSDLNSLEATLIKNNYDTKQVKKVWRFNKNIPERPFAVEKEVIPQAIQELILDVEEIGISAGKVNVVAHGRAGLYARAYIEELEGVKYNNDIQSLITLNTPHSGTQWANLLLDKRQATLKIPISVNILGVEETLHSFEAKKIELSEVFKYLLPTAEREHKQGAKDLQVDQGLVAELNKSENLAKLINANVAMHATSSTAKFCDLSTSTCGSAVHDIIQELPIKHWSFKIAQLLSFVSGAVPDSLDNYFTKVVNGEKHDLMAPKSSLEANLPNQYLSTFTEPIAHTHLGFFNILGIPGITEAPTVATRVVSLLKENPYSSTSAFTFGGITPPSLKYTFNPLDEVYETGYTHSFDLEKIKEKEDDWSNKRIESVIDTADFYFVRDASLKNLKEGDSLKVKVYAKNYEKVLFLCEPDAELDSMFMAERIPHTDQEQFAIKIPKGYFGKVTLQAFGVKNGKLHALDTMQVKVGLNTNLQLLSLHVENSHVQLLQEEQYNYTIFGIFSDSVRRNITEYPGLNFYIEDTNIVKQAGKVLRAVKPGSTRFIAKYNTLLEVIDITVKENPFLKNNIITDFFAIGNPHTYAVNLTWHMYQQYKNKKFVVERGFTETQFDSVGVTTGSGTCYVGKTFTLEDKLPDFKRDLYYRLRFVDSSNNVTYSSVIVLERQATITSFEEPVTLINHNIINVYPNPSKGSTITLEFYVKESEQAHYINLLSLENKPVLSKTLSLNPGFNSVSLTLPADLTPGMYALKIDGEKSVISTKLIINK